MGGEKKIYVRYAPLGGNLIPLTCKETDTIHELAIALKNHANLFELRSEDIKISQMGLHLKDDKGGTRILDFSEPISVIQTNYTVEFTTYRIPVRYIRSVNPVGIPCSQNSVVSELARYIQENISVFRLDRGVSERSKQDGSEVVLMLIIDGEEKLIDPLAIVHSLEGSTVVFKVKSSKTTLNAATDPDEGVEVWVKYSTSGQPIHFICSEDDRVADLAVKIKARIQDFDLTDDEIKEVKDRGSEIILKTIASNLGDKSAVLDPFDNIRDVKQRKLVFSVQTRKMRTVTLDDIKEKCYGQNIAFIGAPGHGKSSTINTIIKALSRLHTPLASTWKGAATGTAALTPFKIDVQGKFFKCIDVPGKALLKFKNESGRGKSAKVIRDVLNGNYPANEPLDFWAWYSPIAIAKYAFKPRAGVVHAVAFVHKGDAEIDRLGATVIEVALAKGRGIPVFAVITHMDLMTSEEVDNAVENVSNGLGIDPSRIYRVSNLDHKEGVAKSVESTERDRYIQRVLLGLLSAAEIYQKLGDVNIK